MGMSSLLTLIENHLEERDASDVPKAVVSRAFIRVFDAYNRGESKVRGGGPDAALKAIAQRIDKTEDESKLDGIFRMIKTILDKGGTVGISIAGEAAPKWTLNATNRKFLEMLMKRVEEKA